MTGEDDRRDGVSRRTLLRTAAATGALASIGGVGARQEQRYEFIGSIGGWFGQAPEEIRDEQNPTLELQAGQRYVVEWENADGFDHNFVIIDADGNQVVRSEIISEQGATQTVEFEATEEMTEYFCEVHPGTMRGDLEVVGREEVTPSQEEDVAPAGPEIGLETIAEGLTAPLSFETAPGVEGSYFVVDQTGQIYVIDGQDGLREEPFLDVSDRMVELGIEELGGYDERGLLGLAFHPDFQENRRFFVRYSAPFRGGLGAEGVEGTETPATTTPEETTPEETTPEETTTGTEGTVGKGGEPEPGYDHTDVLAEFRATEDLTSADPESRQVVMEIASPQDNHNGGALAFGPDGYLHSSIGDGGDADDTGFGHVDDWYDENEGGNGQDVEQNPLGSVMRIDVDAEGDDRAYAIPDDNPLDPDEYDYPEQWAWGFRNPWRMSFNDGQLFVGDAGQNLWEEVDIVENGGNYGWNVKEATHCFNTEEPTESLAQCPDTAPEEAPYDGQELLDPIIEYPHRQATTAFIDGSVVIGGYTYEGDAVPELQGTYLFGNWSGQGVVNPDGEVFAATPPDGDAEAETPGETTTPGGDAQTTVEDAPAAETGPEGKYGGTWSFEELQISGATEGRLDRYVYAFGRDRDGELYVCTNQQFRPEGDTGMVHRIVPAGEGTYTEEEETTPEEEETTPEEEETPEETTPEEEETPEETTPEEETTPGDTPTEEQAEETTVEGETTTE